MSTPKRSTQTKALGHNETGTTVPKMKRNNMTNIKTAKALAARFTVEGDQYDRLPQPATGWVGEDSDFPTRFWRVGGNAVVIQGPFGLEAKRWHEIVTETRGLRYRAR